VAGLGSFVGDFVADGPRALADDFFWLVIGLGGDLDDCSFLLVRLPYWRVLAESDVRHVDRDLMMAGGDGWVWEKQSRTTGTSLRLLRSTPGSSSTLSRGIASHMVDVSYAGHKHRAASEWV
jgi:hypothetical protein